MGEALVDEETAKLAMEMGFEIESDPAESNRAGLLTKVINIGDDVNKPLVLPTQAVLKKWLLDRHGIHIEIIWYKSGYYLYLRLVESSKTIQIKVFVEYATALETGLKEGLKLINQKRLKEKLIGLKTAKLAYNKGFSNEVMFAINGDSDYFEINRIYRNWNDSTYSTLLSAPSHAILCRWLRERHKIYVDTRTEIIDDKVIFKIVVSYGSLLSEWIELDDNFNDYDEAFEAGLLAALNLITIKK